jgi:CRP/FNR family transcriptional regulator
MSLSPEQKDKLSLRYGNFFEEGLIEEIAQQSEYKFVKRDSIILDIGDEVAFMPLILNGSIKIMREDSDHQELLLYYLEYGDTCAMTMNCCMRQIKSPIRATTERDTEILVIPIQNMEHWMVKYPSWRSYVFDSFKVRLDEMLESIDTLAFMNMEERLLKYLHDKAIINSSTEIEVTHQGIATDLHTSRVVVSRILKKLENEGKLELKRNRVLLSDMMLGA